MSTQRMLAGWPLIKVSLVKTDAGTDMETTASGMEGCAVGGDRRDNSTTGLQPALNQALQAGKLL